MGKKPFTFPFEKSHAEEKKKDWGNLKNKFSGKILFRSSFYRLVTGDLSVLDNTGNKWFTEEMLNYSANTLDLNMLPALKKIVTDNGYDEGIRQRSSEIIERIEEREKYDREAGASFSTQRGQVSIDATRKLLAGSRSPQTTEILRLLRDKSPELKRLAVFLVGKFRMTEMIPEVCGSLAVPGVRNDACTVLESLGKDSGRELSRFYLTSAGKLNAHKAALRIIGKICSEENTGFLLEIVLSNLRELKETALKGLLYCSYKIDEADKNRLDLLIYETFGLLSWITGIIAELNRNQNSRLSFELGKEYRRWKCFLRDLLYLTYGNRSQKQERTIIEEEEEINRYIPDLVKIIYGDGSSDEVDEPDNPKNDFRRSKKLQRFFPYESAPLNKIYEDIINCDYNLIGLWTKACTIRAISETYDEEVAESVAALLFSPEEILHEEAARLIAGSGVELYHDISGRIPVNVRQRLDNVVSGITKDKELMFVKVSFLSSCFPAVKEDELVLLARKMKYVDGFPQETALTKEGAIVWCFGSNSSLTGVHIMHKKSDLVAAMANNDTCCYSYVLKLDACEEFTFHYPDSSYDIIKYIDINEG